MEFLLFACLGLVAGTLGGLLGIGGSVIMIPALLFLVPDMTIHLAQAIARGRTRPGQKGEPAR